MHIADFFIIDYVRHEHELRAVADAGVAVLFEVRRGDGDNDGDGAAAERAEEAFGVVRDDRADEGGAVGGGEAVQRRLVDKDNGGEGEVREERGNING